MKKTGAVFLAAGKSSRMGRCKAVMPLGDQTVLERLIGVFQEVGVEQICVVTGFHRERLLPYIEGRFGVFEARNPHPEAGMFSSLRTGLQALSGSCSAMFVLPVDIALVRSCTLELVAKKWRENQGSVVLPFFGEASGHPPLIPSSLTEKICNWSGDMGLRGFFASIQDNIVPVQVPDEQMLLDMDDLAAYNRILSAWQDFDIPSHRECLALLQKVRPIPENIVSHSLMVAALARLMGEKLNQHGGFFNLALLEASGLLHDIARLEPRHGPRGAEILAEMGFGRVAEVIAPHSDMKVATGSPITHQEIVFLADKYWKGDEPVSLAVRYGAKMEKYGVNPEAKAHVAGRLVRAQHSTARFEEQTGVALEELVKQVAEKKRV